MSKWVINSSVASKMGGLFGFKPSVCTTSVEINKNCFHPGEVIKINIDCDNTQSSNAVKSYKFKLHRKVHGVVNTDQGQLQIHKSEYVNAVKTPKGCPAGERLQETFEFKIPRKESSTSDDKMTAVLSGSAAGKNISIEYYLRVFVKHNGLLVLGEGECCGYPLRIHTPNC